MNTGKNIVIDFDTFAENRYAEIMQLRGYEKERISLLSNALWTGSGAHYMKRRDLGYLDTRHLKEIMTDLYPGLKREISCYFDHEEQFYMLGFGAYIALLRLCRAGHKFYIIGNLSNDIGRNVKRLAFYPDEEIEGTVFSSEVHRWMPSSKIFERLFSVYGVDPNDSILISGSRNVLGTGQKYGMAALEAGSQKGMEYILSDIE